MSQKEVNKMENQIGKIREDLSRLGDMRPGSLTRQYRNPTKKEGGYWQLSYTYKMRGRSEHVRPEYVSTIRKEIANFKRFKKLSDKWVELSLQKSKLLMKLARK